MEGICKQGELLLNSFLSLPASLKQRHISSLRKVWLQVLNFRPETWARTAVTVCTLYLLQVNAEGTRQMRHWVDLVDWSKCAVPRNIRFLRSYMCSAGSHGSSDFWPKLLFSIPETEKELRAGFWMARQGGVGWETEAGGQAILLLITS